MKTDQLLKPDAPILQVQVATDNEVTDWLRAQEQSHKLRIVARAIRGAKCGTRAAFFSEIGAACQLPHYFGENWDALFDSMSDLQGDDFVVYVLVVRHAVRLLDQEPGKELKAFAEVMTRTGQSWANSSGKRPASVFRVILHALAGEETKLRARMKEAGVVV
jgi:hypothetical protein